MAEMYEFLRQLLEPTPTVALPRWRHLRQDNRAWQERAVSGFLHAGRILAGFCVVILAMLGLLWWSSSPVNPNAPLAFLYGYGWWWLPVSSIIMLLTVHRWAPFSIAFIFGSGLRNTLTVVVGGPSPNSPITWLRTPRLEALEMLTLFTVVIALTWRFLRDRPAPTTFLDRCALTFFALAALEQVLVDYSFPPVPLLSGITALFIAWVPYHFRRAQHHGHAHRVSNS